MNDDANANANNADSTASTTRTTAGISDRLTQLLITPKPNKNIGTVCRVSGSWGTGKTYAWYEFAANNPRKWFRRWKILPYFRRQHFVYISLFNQQSIDDINSQIILALGRRGTPILPRVLAAAVVFSAIAIAITIALATLADAINLLQLPQLTPFWQGWTTHIAITISVVFAILGWAYYSSVSKITFAGISINTATQVTVRRDKAFRRTIICFDDFERMSANLKIDDVLGLISQLREGKKCNVVMMLNPEKLAKGSDTDTETAADKPSTSEVVDSLVRYGDKVIDYSIAHNPTTVWSYEIAYSTVKGLSFGKGDFKYSIPLEYFKHHEINNIRIMQSTLRTLSYFDSLIDGIDSGIGKKFIIFRIVALTVTHTRYGENQIRKILNLWKEADGIPSKKEEASSSISRLPFQIEKAEKEVDHQKIIVKILSDNLDEYHHSPKAPYSQEDMNREWDVELMEKQILRGKEYSLKVLREDLEAAETEYSRLEHRRAEIGRELASKHLAEATNSLNKGETQELSEWHHQDSAGTAEMDLIIYELTLAANISNFNALTDNEYFNKILYLLRKTELNRKLDKMINEDVYDKGIPKVELAQNIYDALQTCEGEIFEFLGSDAEHDAEHVIKKMTWYDPSNSDKYEALGNKEMGAYVRKIIVDVCNNPKKPDHYLYHKALDTITQRIQGNSFRLLLDKATRESIERFAGTGMSVPMGAANLDGLMDRYPDADDLLTNLRSVIAVHVGNALSNDPSPLLLILLKGIDNIESYPEKHDEEVEWLYDKMTTEAIKKSFDNLNGKVFLEHLCDAIDIIIEHYPVVYGTVDNVPSSTAEIEILYDRIITEKTLHEIKEKGNHDQRLDAELLLKDLYYYSEHLKTVRERHGITPPRTLGVITRERYRRERQQK